MEINELLSFGCNELENNFKCFYGVVYKPCLKLSFRELL